MRWRRKKIRQSLQSRCAKRVLTHIALIVRDYDEAIAWFTGVLGFTLVEDGCQPERDKPGAISADGDSQIATSKRWVAPPGAGENAASILLARAATPEQERFIGNQAGERVFLFLRTDDFWRDYRAPRRQGRPLRPPTRRAALWHRRHVRSSVRQSLEPDRAGRERQARAQPLSPTSLTGWPLLEGLDAFAFGFSAFGLRASLFDFF